MKDITTEEAINWLKKYIIDIKKVDTCENRTKIQSIEKVLNELENYNEGNIVSLKLLEKYYLISKNKGKQSFVDEEFFKEYIPKEVVEEKDKIIDIMAKTIATPKDVEHLFTVRELNERTEEVKKIF
jgi:hypothetical protein